MLLKWAHANGDQHNCGGVNNNICPIPSGQGTSAAGKVMRSHSIIQCQCLNLPSQKQAFISWVEEGILRSRITIRSYLIRTRSTPLVWPFVDMLHGRRVLTDCCAESIGRGGKLKRRRNTGMVPGSSISLFLLLSKSFHYWWLCLVFTR